MDDGVGANKPYCRPMRVFGIPRNLSWVGPEHISFTLKVWSPYEDAHEGVAFGWWIATTTIEVVFVTY